MAEFSASVFQNEFLSDGATDVHAIVTVTASGTGAAGSDGAAAEIIIGNPTIADISVQSGNLLVITGKTFGITNIIALDADRNVIQDQRVLVKRDESKVVNLQRGTQRQSYNCTPQCNPSITIGDEQKFFDAVATASQKKINFSSSGGDSPQPGSN